MQTDDILVRLTQVVSAMGDSPALLQIERNGDRLRFLTGTRSLRQSRLLARILGVLGLVAGLALTQISPSGWALAVLGVLTFFIIPGRLRPTRLLEIDAAHGNLLVTQSAAGAGGTISLAQIASIRGAYDTQGWDPFSTLYAVLQDGQEVPVLVFRGTNEPLAEYTCRILGFLLDRPATYAGPFGGIKTCYQPL